MFGVVSFWVNAQTCMSFPVKMLAHTYRDKLLVVHVRPYARAKVDAFVLQDNDARPYRARMVDAYRTRSNPVHTIASSITGP
ncbi:hypothetical protein TNCV_2908491 [Trichonephila clavipes]|nr:hypothetical protein TNCV_2908491 [Trichonephila clavipes]